MNERGIEKQSRITPDACSGLVIPMACHRHGRNSHVAAISNPAIEKREGDYPCTHGRRCWLHCWGSFGGAFCQSRAVTTDSGTNIYALTGIFAISIQKLGQCADSGFSSRVQWRGAS